MFGAWGTEGRACVDTFFTEEDAMIEKIKVFIEYNYKSVVSPQLWNEKSLSSEIW